MASPWRWRQSVSGLAVAAVANADSAETASAYGAAVTSAVEESITISAQAACPAECTIGAGAPTIAGAAVDDGAAATTAARPGAAVTRVAAKASDDAGDGLATYAAGTGGTAGGSGSAGANFAVINAFGGRGGGGGGDDYERRHLDLRLLHHRERPREIYG